MANKNKLKAKIIENGFNIAEFAEKVEMKKSSFYQKLNNVYDFSTKDIKAIKEHLCLTDSEIIEIFFDQ